MPSSAPRLLRAAKESVLESRAVPPLLQAGPLPFAFLQSRATRTLDVISFALTLVPPLHLMFRALRF